MSVVPVSDEHFRLDGKQALVTGGSRGIGAAIALELARAGADIISVQRSSEEPAVAEAVRNLGRRFISRAHDLAATETIPALVDQLLADYGPVHILVHSAGTITRHRTEEFPIAEYDETMNLHLKAAFVLGQCLGKPMLERGAGKIIFIGSLNSVLGGYKVAPYSVAKAGVANLARALSNEWAGRGVNVNTVLPGYIRTDLNASLQADPVRSAQISVRIPAGRWGAPEDVAPVVRFLATDAARYVHGQSLAVDGGYLGR